MFTLDAVGEEANKYHREGEGFTMLAIRCPMYLLEAYE
jgi:hypothetical protein